jgi:hypothetical protein
MQLWRLAPPGRKPSALACTTSSVQFREQPPSNTTRTSSINNSPQRIYDKEARDYLIYPIDQTHELAHAVAMIVRRTERVLGHKPSWREYHKIK